MANIISDGIGRSFSIGDYIDRGSFSKVYTLECCSTKKKWAGKFISKEKLIKYGIIKSVWTEIKIHRILRHQNIVQFLTYIEQENEIVIILEYCSRYSMVHVLHALKKLTLGEAKYFMAQIVFAVEYLHAHKIVHRDLKLGNLFVNKKLEVKLGDFGLAVTVEFEGQKRFSRCGTPNYLAPEVINAIGHSFEVDIWALGCILYTMLEGTPPFQGENTTSTYNNILKCCYSFSKNINPSAKTFIMNCLQPEPYLRPSIFQLNTFEFLASEEIPQEPPKFTFVDDEHLTLFRKSMKVAGPKLAPIVHPIVESEENDHVNGCLMKLYKCLRHVKNWPESKFGEFLAESNSVVPLVWVNSWMDYTNSYGFAYKLSNNNSGMIFNDSTRMLYLQGEGSVQYSKRNESIFVYQKQKVPETLRKKTKILLSCLTYMNEVLTKAHEAKVTDGKQKIRNYPEVIEWTKGENEVAMLLSNGSMQVNFLIDHTKLIISGCDKTVTVIETAQFMKSVKLDTLQSCGCSRNLKAKLYIALKHIHTFLTNKGS